MYTLLRRFSGCSECDSFSSAGRGSDRSKTDVRSGPAIPCADEIRSWVPAAIRAGCSSGPTTSGAAVVESTLYLPTSDNSDPNENERRCTIRVDGVETALVDVSRHGPSSGSGGRSGNTRCSSTEVDVCGIAGILNKAGRVAPAQLESARLPRDGGRRSRIAGRMMKVCGSPRTRASRSRPRRLSIHRREARPGISRWPQGRAGAPSSPSTARSITSSS